MGWCCACSNGRRRSSSPRAASASGAGSSSPAPAISSSPRPKRNSANPTALDWGLINEVAEDPVAAALAYFDAHLAARSASSLGYALKAVRAPLIARLRNRLAEVETLYLNGLMTTRDAVEGLQAFLDKRAPKWEHK
jgi:1,4-dihydroxy-2-naphthoyl-CoA synthase